MAIGLCDTSLERLSIKGCFTRGEIGIGTGLIELEVEVKIVFAVGLSLSRFFCLFVCLFVFLTFQLQ